MLRHQFALQAVGHAANHALVAAKRLIELGAQPVQFARPAQIVNLHHLIKFGGEDFIRQRLAARRDVVGLVAAIIFGGIFIRHVRLLLISGLLLSIVISALIRRRTVTILDHLLVVFALALGGGLLAWSVGRVLAALIILIVALTILRRLDQFFAQAQMGEQLAGRAGKAFLITDTIAQIANLTCDLGAQPFPPIIEHFGLLAVALVIHHLLAGEQLDDFRHGRVDLALLGFHRLTGAVQFGQIVPHAGQIR